LIFSPSLDITFKDREMRKLVNQKSSFWAGESFFDDEVDVITGQKRDTNDVVALAA